MITLCTIGDARLEVIGLNPQEFQTDTEPTWSDDAVFGEGNFYQPTSRGEETVTLRLATRPHTHGGLDQYAILKRHCRNLDVVMFMRLMAAASGLPVGEVMGNVFIRSLSAEEKKIAPDGIGWRYECTAELVFVGEMAGEAL